MDGAAASESYSAGGQMATSSTCRTVIYVGMYVFAMGSGRQTPLD